MRVAVDSHADLRVVEDRAHRFRIDSGPKEQGRAVVPEIVVANLRHAGLCAELAEDARDRARVNQCAGVRREDERPGVPAPGTPRRRSSCLLLRALPFEGLGGGGRQGEWARALLRLRREPLPLPLDVLELPADNHQPRVEVDVFPGEPQDFPLAEPETERDREERPEPVVARREEEALRFVVAPRRSGRRRGGDGTRERRRVVGAEPFADGVLKHALQDGAALLEGARRQVLLCELLEPLLDRCRGERAQTLPAELGQDLVARDRLVGRA